MNTNMVNKNLEYFYIILVSTNQGQLTCFSCLRNKDLTPAFLI
jgi:hypothetical protein